MSGVQVLNALDFSPGGRPFGLLLKEWRNRRGLSQLNLALAVRSTQRHLSFLESGRAMPSRDMILRLSGAMDIPLRQQNSLLIAAGYAPLWRERHLSAPDLGMVNTALDYMLGQHEPYPAFVVDRAGTCSVPIAARSDSPNSCSVQHPRNLQPSRSISRSRCCHPKGCARL